MRFTDMMLALPQLPLLLVIILLFRDTLRVYFGPELGIFLLIVFVIGILGWMATARIVRSTVLSIKEKEFVEAAVNVGSGQRRILGKHILPNVMSPIIVSATLAVAAAILTESALSFLGLGFPSDVPTWGRLLFDGKDFMTFTPWVVIWPGLFISLSVLSINFIGDGLRDAMDPRAAALGPARPVLRTVYNQSQRPGEVLSGPLFSQGFRSHQHPALTFREALQLPGRLQEPSRYLAAAYFSATLFQSTTFHHAET